MELPPSSEIKGFLPDTEGWALYQLAQQGALHGPLLEIGSYCGRSTLWLAQAAHDAGTVVFAIDHHRGSEEHQVGEFFHDPELTDQSGRFDSLPTFRANVAAAGVESAVIPMICDAASLAPFWHQPLGLLFIDGGHSLDAALADYRAWVGHIAPGGILAIHDVFPDPTLGGQAPYTIWQMAADSGLFEPILTEGSLRGLRRLA
jgi:predicted O-methyltransferase YrrM